MENRDSCSVDGSPPTTAVSGQSGSCTVKPFARANNFYLHVFSLFISFLVIYYHALVFLLWDTGQRNMEVWLLLFREGETGQAQWRREQQTATFSNSGIYLWPIIFQFSSAQCLFMQLFHEEQYHELPLLSFLFVAAGRALHAPLPWPSLNFAQLWPRYLKCSHSPYKCSPSISLRAF